MVSRSKQWKYVHFTNLPPLLYDLEADPHEQHNLAQEPALAVSPHAICRRL